MTAFPSVLPWPETLDESPSIQVIERAIARKRLSHSLLLTGSDHDLLLGVAYGIADRLLNPPDQPVDRRRAVNHGSHPDLFELRPAKKMRQISAESTRELIGKVQVSATLSKSKVAIIHECDRMHITASNIFLKTLEEPPANTSLLLLTTRPYSLLTTIRSRCLHFRFPSTLNKKPPEGWESWIEDYNQWLKKLVGGISGKSDAADALFAAYGLIARFESVLKFATGELWKVEKTKLPEDITEDEQIAIETGLSNGLRLRFFADIEEATCRFSRESVLEDSNIHVRQAFPRAVSALEHQVGLLRLNLNVSAALEGFMLESLRLWVSRG